MPPPIYASKIETIWYYVFRIIAFAVLFFLIAPIFIIIPLSFNSEPYFSFTSGMLSLESAAYSLRWYMDILQNGMVNPDAEFSLSWLADSWQNAQWIHSMKNSLFIAIFSTILSTTLGTLAALGLSRPDMPYRKLTMAILISPMIVPLIITAAGMFFFFSKIGLSQTYIGIIFAHTILGTPFVVITVTATLMGFDRRLIQAGMSLGATPTYVFFKVVMPLILPGVISGALFAFVTSFDEIVVVLFLSSFEQRTVPRQMWSGLREQISPTILAMATILVLLSVSLLATLELLRRRTERLRGTIPQ